MKKVNQSGIIPLEYKVIVHVAKVEETTAGGIIIPDATREEELNAKVDAVIVDYGDLAFDGWDLRPVVGANVFVAKYGGIQFEGEDGEHYRLLNDKDLLAIKTY